MTATHVDPREALAQADNPLALQGIEFVEYATAKPQTFGQSLNGWASGPSRGTARARCCSTARAT